MIDLNKIKPWEERMEENAAAGNRIGSPQQFMAAEISEWRASATQDSAPAELPSPNLEALAEQYISGLDDENEDEYFCTEKALVGGNIDDFVKFVRAAAPASPQPVAKVLTLDWPACNPACEYEDPHGGIHDCRSEGCSCEAAKASIARQRAASTPTTLTGKKDA